MKVKRICPICGNFEVKKIDDINLISEKEVMLPNHYEIVCCEKCGFAYADMSASQEMFDEYYSKMNIYSEAEELRKINMNMDSMYLKYILQLFVKYIEVDAQVIDVGCGGGQLLDYLKIHGFRNLTGLDPSEKSINIIKERGYKGIVKSLFDVIEEKDNNAYDLVISTMVAEHVYDLSGYVQQLRGYVKKGGYIFVSVPAVEGFKDYICDKPNYFNQEHINYFSGKSLQNLFGEYGLWLVNTEYINELEQEKCLYMLFEYRGEERELEVDNISFDSIKCYLSGYNDKKEELNRKMQKLIESGKSLVFWGSGQYAKQIISEHPDILSKILYFVDNNTMKHGKHLGGKKIASPAILGNENEEVVICVCSMKNSREIEEDIRQKYPDKDICVL